jgi:methyl-branched lipid omega-hydroxylase
VALTDIDLGSEDFWSLDDAARDGAFATLRREAPISFQREPVSPGYQVGEGHWILTKFDGFAHLIQLPLDKP